MLSVITNYLQAKLLTLPYLTALGIAARVERNGETMPAFYNGSELMPIDFDKYRAMAYILPNGNVPRETIEHPFKACAYLVTEIYGYKIVVYSQAKEAPLCESLSQNITWGVSGLLTGKQLQLETAAGFQSVTISTVNTVTDKAEVWKSQTSLANPQKDTDVMLAIDIEVEVSGVESCFNLNPCAPTDFHFDILTGDFCDMVSDCIGVSGADSISFLYNSANTSYTFDGTVTAKNPDGKDFRGKTLDELYAGGLLRLNIPTAFYTWNSTTGVLAFVATKPANNTPIYLKLSA